MLKYIYGNNNAAKYYIKICSIIICVCNKVDKRKHVHSDTQILILHVCISVSTVPA